MLFRSIKCSSRRLSQSRMGSPSHWKEVLWLLLQGRKRVPCAFHPPNRGDYSMEPRLLPKWEWVTRSYQMAWLACVYSLPRTGQVEFQAAGGSLESAHRMRVSAHRRARSTLGVASPRAPGVDLGASYCFGSSLWIHRASLSSPYILAAHTLGHIILPSLTTSSVGCFVEWGRTRKRTPRYVDKYIADLNVAAIDKTVLCAQLLRAKSDNRKHCLILVSGTAGFAELFTWSAYRSIGFDFCCCSILALFDTHLWRSRTWA